ncbi:hypothetical protein AAF712_015925 [Marasmius tenuissimus]|uniref:Uncharacterized protein n=1 Tax=Marasmius tenuissimus TaxID=585030 RepID=A0ABR2Z952_9AGAR
MAAGWVIIENYEVPPHDRLLNPKEDVEVQLTTTVNTPLHWLVGHERCGANLDIHWFLKVDPKEPRFRYCLFCLLLKDEGAIEKVQAYSSASATSVVRQHMHNCHIEIWSNLIKLEYLWVQKKEDWELVYADADALEPNTDTDADANTEVETEVGTDSNSNSDKHTGGN